MYSRIRRNAERTLQRLGSQALIVTESTTIFDASTLNSTTIVETATVAVAELSGETVLERRTAGLIQSDNCLFAVSGNRAPVLTSAFIVDGDVFTVVKNERVAPGNEPVMFLTEVSK